MSDEKKIKASMVEGWTAPEDAGWVSDDVQLYKLDAPVHSPFGEEVNFVLASVLPDETAIFAVDENGYPNVSIMPGMNAAGSLADAFAPLGIEVA